MDQPVTKAESYANRRKLFKDIWDTTMGVKNNKNGEIFRKSKVIKTLRLDEVDHLAGKIKKQKIKNLRTVCNKLLEFCDHQQAQLLYEQTTLENKGLEEPDKANSEKTKSTAKPKKKFRNGKSMMPSSGTRAKNVTVGKHKVASGFADRTLRNTSPIKIKHASCKHTNKPIPKQTTDNNIIYIRTNKKSQ